jgi:hypothetical protein
MDLPLYAVQRCGDGRWLVRSLIPAKPCLPAGCVVAVLDERSPHDLFVLQGNRMPLGDAGIETIDRMGLGSHG